MEMDITVADDYVLDLIKELTEKCISLSEPKACYKLIPAPELNIDTSELNLGGQIFNLSKIVASALKKGTHIALFVCTCGKEVEKYSKRLMNEGHSLEGLIVDLVASELAEGLADFIHNKIEQNAANEGLKITNRYSPGYCNWPVSDQQKLFKLIHENTCGVKLTPSSLMLPIKSVSGIIAIGPDVKFRGYACAKCDDKQCIYRNRR